MRDFWHVEHWAMFAVEITLCAMLIIVVRWLFGKRLGPATCRLMWGVLIVRCLIPVSIPTAYHPLSSVRALKEPDVKRSVTSGPVDTSVELSMNEIKEPGVGRSATPEPAANSVEFEIGSLERNAEQTQSMELQEIDSVLTQNSPEVALRFTSGSLDNSALQTQNSTPAQSGPEVVLRSTPGSLTPPLETPPPIPSPNSTLHTPNSTLCLAIVWVIGSMTVLVLALRQNRNTVGRASRSPEPVADWVQEIFLECRNLLKLKTWPVLIVTPHVDAPCLAGAIRPRVLLPKRLIDATGEASREQIRHVLLHELTHLKQGDIWFSWCWTLVLALHWYNPILWWVGRMITFDCEAACDQRVLERLAPERRREYGYSLLEILQKLNPPKVRVSGFNAVVENTTNFERRLVMITKFRKRTPRQTVAGMLLIPCLLAVSLTTFAQQKPTPISPDKAKLIGYVEDYFLHNRFEIEARRSHDWSDITTDENGTGTIRYSYTAFLQDGSRSILIEDFTFDKDGRFVTSKTVESKPVKPATRPNVSVSSAETFDPMKEMDEILKMQDQLVEMAQEIQIMEGEECDLAEKVVELQRKLDNARNNKDMSESERDELSHSLAILENQLSSLSKNLRERNAKAEALQNKIKAREQMLEQKLMVYQSQLQNNPNAQRDEPEVKQSVTASAKAEESREYKELYTLKQQIYELKTQMSRLNQEKKLTTLKLEEIEVAKEKIANESLAVKDKESFENLSQKTNELIQAKTDFRKKANYVDAELAKLEQAKEELEARAMFLEETLALKQRFENNNTTRSPVSQTTDAQASEKAAAEGWRFWMKQNWAEAESKFQEAVKLDPANANAFQGLGWTLTNQNRAKAAQEAFEKCLALEPKNAAALNGMGWCAREYDDKDKAIEWWQKAVEADPTATAAIAGLVRTYNENQDYKNAVKYYKMWLDAEPKNEDAKAGLQKAEEQLKEKR